MELQYFISSLRIPDPLKNGVILRTSKNPCDYTGSFTLPLEGPWGFLGLLGFAFTGDFYAGIGISWDLTDFRPPFFTITEPQRVFLKVMRGDDHTASWKKTNETTALVVSWMDVLNIWGFPKMVVPNNHGFSY